MTSSNAKFTLLALFALFLVPLVTAWLMYTGVIEFSARDTSNLGNLVEPPVQAEWPEVVVRLGLAGHWLVLYPVSLGCGEGCRADLTGLRQIKRALGRDGERLRAIVMSGEVIASSTSETVATIDPGFVLIEGARNLEKQLGNIGAGKGSYIVDPLGNIMMHYPPGADPNDIRLDLEHLLKYGKTDPR